ncbi:MAG: hypothetical protein JWM31_1283, partial [Solirubrobacterales bacterium]|nr:hypothetical protein [Solirubrobacterales bacterium]
ILASGAFDPPPPFDPGPLPLPTISLGCPATAIAGDAVRITGSTSTPLPVQITVTAPDGTQTSRQVRDVSQAGDPSFATTVEVIQTGTWTVQATAPVQQPATCSIAVTQTPTALTAACGPDPVPPGGAAAVSGVLTPAGEPRSIVLRYVPTGAGQTTVVRTVTTDALGRWSDSGFLPVAQQYDVTASFAGTTPLAASSSAPCRIALPAVTLACPASAIAGARVSVTGTTNVTATPVHLIITAPDGTPTEHDVSARGGTYADDFPVAVAGTWRVGAAAGGAEAPPCLITVTAPPPPPSTTPTSLTITCPQGMVQTGQAVTTSGRLTPAAAGQTITVRYVPTVGQSATVVRATTTDAGGNYADSGFVTQAAQYDVTASFAGNGTLAPSASPTCRFTRS